MTQGTNSFSWRVKDVLEAHQISVYRLAQELAGKVSRNTVYSTAGGEAKRVDLDTLGSILAALRRLTGNADLSVADLLEYKPIEGDSSETADVLADHPEIVERVRKLEAGESKLIPWPEIKAKMGL